LAAEKQADMILSDDRLLRKTAAIEGLRVIGTIGVLIRSAKSSPLTQKKSVTMLDELVKDHNFRISTCVYESARTTIGSVQ